MNLQLDLLQARVLGYFYFLKEEPLHVQALLDTTTDEWVITTPDDGALKWCVYLPLT